jgi:hypothetical protein
MMPSSNQVTTMNSVTAAVLSMMCCAATAAEAPLHASELVSYGIFSAKSENNGLLDNGVPVTTVSEVLFEEYTHTIPAELGANFGFQYVIHGSSNRATNVSHLIMFPAPGLSTPAGERHAQFVSQEEVIVGHRVLHGYSFDESWEMVPGDWVFEVWHNDSKLLRQVFTVTKKK